MYLIFVLLLMLCPAALWAAPVQVTLFPDSAQVKEVTSIAAERTDDGFSSARLILPGQADPATLSFAGLSGAAIADLTWTRRQERNQAALTELNARLAELQAKRNTLLADQESIQGQMNFWKAQAKPAEQTPAAMRELAAELGNALRADAEALSAVQTQIEKLDGRIAEVEKNLEEASRRRRWAAPAGPCS